MFVSLQNRCYPWAVCIAQVACSVYIFKRLYTMKCNTLSIYLNFICQNIIVSRRMGRPAICIGESKGADQLCGNREAERRLCFRYTNSRIPLLLDSKIASFLPSSLTVQAGLCWTWSELKLLVFSHTGSSSFHLFSFSF